MTWILGAVAVVGVAALWLWRQGKALDQVAGGIVLLRAMADTHPRFRPASPGDGHPGGPRGVDREVEDAGFRRVGDFWEEVPRAPEEPLTTWFVHDDGTVCGWFGITQEGPALFLVSEVDGRGWVATYRGPEAPQLARPEAIHLQAFPPSRGLGEVVGAHREACRALGAPPAPLSRAADADAAQNLVRRMRAHGAAWRGSQPYEALLEEDVRAIAGVRFYALGPTLMDQIRTLEGR